MYQDCLCLNELNFYGNGSIWQDSSLPTHNNNHGNNTYPLWDKPIQPCPDQFLISASFEPCYSGPFNFEGNQPLLIDSEPTANLAAAMTFCSSSSSSLVSSPSLTHYNNNTCIMPNMIPFTTSNDPMFLNNPMPVNHHAPFIPADMNPMLYASLPLQPTQTRDVKPTKCTAKNKIYDCNLCPRSFARKHDLQRHIRVHTGAKPYYCLNCEKAFARTDALKRHLRMEESCRMSPVIQALKNVGMRRYRNL